MQFTWTVVQKGRILGTVKARDANLAHLKAEAEYPQWNGKYLLSEDAIREGYGNNLAFSIEEDDKKGKKRRRRKPKKHMRKREFRHQ